MDAAISLQDAAAIAGLFISGIAALAATAAIWLTLRADKRARQPLLRIQPLVSHQTGFYGASIINIGDAAATGALFVVADRRSYICGPVMAGFLRPGEMVEVFADRPPEQTGDRFLIAGFVTGRDRFGFAHDWNSAEKETRHYNRPLRRCFRKTPVYGEIIGRLATHFPEWPEPESLEQAGVNAQNRTPPG